MKKVRHQSLNKLAMYPERDIEEEQKIDENEDVELGF